MIAVQKPEFNPVSPENLSNPVPHYRALREQEPVHWSDEVQAWFITRHEDVVACFRDPRLSSNRKKLYEAQFRDPGPDALPAFLRFVDSQMAMKDGAEHIRARRQANPGFTAQTIESWRPAIRRITEELVERVLPLGCMDVVTELSYQLPPRVIAEVLGVPTRDQERFVAWSGPLVDISNFSPGADLRTLALRAEEAARALHEYLGALIEERRRAPGRDVLSQMVLAQQEGGTSPEDLVSDAVLILFAGHTTTTDQISNGIHALLTHPDELRKLQANPALVKSAVEEILRFNPAVPFIHRIAAETLELHGRTIPQGSMVFLGMAAANRDPAAFSDPDRFDITRAVQQKVLSFGFGPHQCLGAHLARRELEVVLEVLFQRLPGLRLDEEHPPRPKNTTLFSHGLDALHVRW